MSVSKLNKLILSCFIVLFCAGCMYYPWEREVYENLKTKGMEIEEIRSRFPEFSVNGAFVNIFLRGTNETSRSGKAPYGIYIVVWCKEDARLKSIIHDIKINSDLKRNYDIPLQFPYAEEIAGRADRGYINQSIVTPFMYNFEVKGKEKIVISIDIEIVSEDGSERKTIEYDFVPVIEKGTFDYVQV